MVERTTFGKNIREIEIDSVRGLRAYMKGYNFVDNEKHKRLYFEWKANEKTYGLICISYWAIESPFSARIIILHMKDHREDHYNYILKLLREGTIDLNKLMDLCTTGNWFARQGPIYPIPELNIYVGKPEEGKQVLDYINSMRSML
jgi:hypothetical protein